MYIVITEAYGPFKEHDRKEVFKEGRDFYLLKSRGTIYHVPKNVCRRG